MSMPTIAEINSMTDEEKRALNVELGRRLMKQIALKAAVTIAVVATVHIVANILEKRQNNTTEI